MNNNQPITLITGTSRGIGKGMAEYFANNGHIVIGCSRKEVEFKHDNYTHIVADITVEKDILAIFTHIKKTYGRLDNLVNNAGIGSTSLGLLTSTTLFDNVYRTNAIAPFIFIREAAKIMLKRNYGRIINFTSGGVPMNLDGALPYTVSKAAVEMITKSFAQELAPYNITVNALGPGVTKTEMLDTFVSEEKCNDLIQNHYMIKENSTIDDMINIVKFYMQKESNHITSQILYLCGPK